MCFMHPLYLLISLCCSTAYGIYLKGHKAIRFSLLYMLPMVLMAMIINPIFNHQGATLLTYLPSGNPLTLESIIYGIGAAFMLMAVITWFSCYTEIMTSDKFIYLFGRIIPSVSLILSMALGFVPKFKARAQLAADTQKAMGFDISKGSFFKRAKIGIRILSILITWSLEKAIETADSMKSRGYGLPGRTAFSIYYFNKRDKKALAWLIFCVIAINWGWITGKMEWRYYPTLKGAEISLLTIFFQLCYTALCLTPFIINIREDRKWRRLQSEI